MIISIMLLQAVEKDLELSAFHIGRLLFPYTPLHSFLCYSCQDCVIGLTTVAVYSLHPNISLHILLTVL